MTNSNGGEAGMADSGDDVTGCSNCGGRGRVPVRDDRSTPGAVHGMRQCPDCAPRDMTLTEAWERLDEAVGKSDYPEGKALEALERLSRELKRQRDALIRIKGINASNTSDPARAANIMRHEAADSLSSTWPNYREDVAP